MFDVEMCVFFFVYNLSKVYPLSKVQYADFQHASDSLRKVSNCWRGNIFLYLKLFTVLDSEHTAYAWLFCVGL